MSDDNDCAIHGDIEDTFRDTERALRKKIESLTTEGGAKDVALELAWGIIANAYGSDWSLAHADWHGAAIRWRDNYRENLISDKSSE